ncbi:MAG: hypothetical protein LWW95_03215 [Candidatus Desulfofervidus auxilii]|nr:hypothetical protein [Candidatus Desulfofervidus auxilii]
MSKIFGFSLLLILLLSQSVLADSYQKSYGAQSPNIIAGGDVKIKYNNKQKLL